MNRRPSDCQSDALPAELQPHINAKLTDYTIFRHVFHLAFVIALAVVNDSVFSPKLFKFVMPSSGTSLNMHNNSAKIEEHPAGIGRPFPAVPLDVAFPDLLIDRIMDRF